MSARSLTGVALTALLSYAAMMSYLATSFTRALDRDELPENDR